ncbi:MAG: PASTA domain-containing protein [Bacillota bacterium]|nr:PASTA domain-containing protein [Bacillota bacterium]
MQDILQHLNIQPQYSDAELKQLQSKKTTVPDVSEEGLENAIGKLAGKNLNYELSPALDVQNGEIIVTDQYPKAGEEVLKESTVTLYYEIVENEFEEIVEEKQ